MEHPETDSKLNTVNGVAHGVKRDMDAQHPDQNMQPTPVQPHLAHCCTCNAAEITASAERQRMSEFGGRERELLAEKDHQFRTIVAWAGEVITKSSPGAPCIESATELVDALFKRELAALKSPGLPAFDK